MSTPPSAKSAARVVGSDTPYGHVEAHTQAPSSTAAVHHLGTGVMEGYPAAQRSTIFSFEQHVCKELDQDDFRCDQKDKNDAAKVAQCIGKKSIDSLKIPVEGSQDVDLKAVKKSATTLLNSAKSSFKKETKPTPEPIILSPAQKDKILKALADIFEEDVRSIERLNLPLELFCATPTERECNAMESVLHISYEAMEKCILPCLKSLAPDHVKHLDFAFCTIEKNALVPLLDAIYISPDCPTVRMARELSPSEKQAMYKKMQRILKDLKTNTEQEWIYRKSPGKLSKGCCEPIYYLRKAPQENRRSDDLPCLQESFHRIVYVKDILKDPELIDSAAATAVKAVKVVGSMGLLTGNAIDNAPCRLGYVTIQRWSSERLSRAVSAQKNMSPPPAAAQKSPELTRSASRTGTPERKPLPPAPKGNNTSALQQAYAEWKNKGDQHLHNSELDTAKEAFTKALEIAEKLKNSNYISDCKRDLGSVCLAWKTKGNQLLQACKFDPAIDAFTKALEIAEFLNDVASMTDCAREMGKVFLERKDWRKAAELFNAAYALCQKDPQQREVLENLMLEVEKRFLRLECGVSEQVIQTLLHTNLYSKRRTHLENNRQCVQEEESVYGALQAFSSAQRKFVDQMFQEIYKILGPQSCPSTVVFLGSGAHGEMCLNSDLEYCRLIAQDTSQNREYYRRVDMLFAIRMIHLGETKCDILKRGTVSPTPQRFCLDKGGNSPLGKIEMTNTPQKMATLQYPKNFNEDLIRSNTVQGIEHFVGDPQLFQEYSNQIKSILDSRSAQDPYSLRQRRALFLMRGHLKEFSPSFRNVLDAKKDLCRLIMFLTSAFAEFLDIPVSNTMATLDALKNKGFNPTAVDNLQTALNCGMGLRLKAHDHYGNECDLLFLESDQEAKTIENPLIVSKKEKQKILFILRVLLPLYHSFEEFVKTQDLAKLKKQNMYDATLFPDEEEGVEAR